MNIINFFKTLSSNKPAQDDTLFYTMIENSDDCFYVADLEDNARMLYVNKAAERHYGFPRETIYTWQVSDWDPNFKAEDTPALIQQIKDAKSLTIETKHRVHGDSIVPVEVTINHFMGDENQNLAYGWFKNISERLELERLQIETKLLTEAKQQTEQAYQELEKAIQTIKTISGIVPLCAWCSNKIKQDDGSWVRLEKFLELNSDAQISHSICPDCREKHLK